MQAAGNDFVLFDNRQLKLERRKIIELTPKLCDRRFGVGADGILTLLPPDDPSLDYTMFYRNADGSDAGMCGNGARCLALYAERTGLGKDLHFNVHSNIYRAHVDPENSNVQIEFPMQLEVQPIQLSGKPTLYQVDAGTEHIVQRVSSDVFEDRKKLKQMGQKLRCHSWFEPKGTNVNFVYVNNQNQIKLRTYERGVENLTLACGTGAIAAAIARHRQNDPHPGHHELPIQTDGGELKVKFIYEANSKSYSDIELLGEAHFVFEGKWPG